MFFVFNDDMRNYIWAKTPELCTLNIVCFPSTLLPSSPEVSVESPIARKLFVETPQLLVIRSFPFNW